MKHVVLAGDIGGTKVNLALVECDRSAKVVVQKTYPSADFNCFSDVVKAFQAAYPHQPRAACVGVAGPVIDRKVDVTNLPWVVDARDLNRLGYQDSWLLNDLVAHAVGIAVLDEKGLVTLQEGVAEEGNRCLIAAGTGLGESILFPFKGRWIASPSEGGHVDFSPNTRQEIELSGFLMNRYRRVSWERVLSGKFGFRNLLDFLMASGQYWGDEEFYRSLDDENTLGPQVVEAAERGVPVALAVVRLFARLYGSEAGNLALKALAINGIYIGGGIAQHLLPWLKEEGFRQGLTNKGRFGSLVSRIPVHVITDPDNAIKGAAFFAYEHLEGLA